MDVHNGSAVLTSEALRCFTRSPRQILLLPGERLFRFTTMPGPAFKGNEVFASPWWIPHATYRQIAQTAQRTGRTSSEVARARLAVAEAWNPNMDWLTILELRKPVHAWVGPTKPQPLFDGDRGVILLGNYDQAYVPDLASRGAQASAAGALVYFGAAST